MDPLENAKARYEFNFGFGFDYKQNIYINADVQFC